jgi:cytochrome c-type biogenesis protein CcmH/NrfF
VKPLCGATLSPQRANPDYHPPRQPWSEENAWVLWVAIVAAVLVVGGIIVKLMRSIASSGPQG